MLLRMVKFRRSTSTSRTPRGIAILLSLTIFCLKIIVWDDSQEAKNSSVMGLSPSPGSTNNYHEETHEGDRLCFALVDDGKIQAASVISEDGYYVNLLLPMTFEGYVTVECTVTNQTTGEISTNSHNKLIVVREIEGPAGPNPVESMYFEQPLTNCDRKGFQPGYLDRSTNRWHYDDCATRARKTINRSPHRTELARGNCPRLASAVEADVWASFVGDSVTRQIFSRLLYESGIPMKEWRRDGRAGGVHPDLILAVDDRADYRIWLTFTHEFISPDTMMPRWGMPSAWRDFAGARGPVDDDDPAFSADRVPDFAFYSPGYCSSNLNATQFGDAIDGILDRWQHDMMNGRNATRSTMPKLHVLLNMMPAPWMIPEKYAEDRPHRTQLNEYRKNLAIISAAKKHSFVVSVLDLFSVELPFNGRPDGQTAHQDAVHIGDPMVLRIASNLIIDKLCNFQ